MAGEPGSSRASTSCIYSVYVRVTGTTVSPPTLTGIALVSSFFLAISKTRRETLQCVLSFFRLCLTRSSRSADEFVRRDKYCILRCFWRRIHVDMNVRCSCGVIPENQSSEFVHQRGDLINIGQNACDIAGSTEAADDLFLLFIAIFREFGVKNLHVQQTSFIVWNAHDLEDNHYQREKPSRMNLLQQWSFSMEGCSSGVPWY